MQQLGVDEGYRFPLALPSLTLGRYVDDICRGADTVQTLMEMAQQLNNFCKAGGFPLAKWYSTDPELLAAVDSTQSDISAISLDDCVTKLLGLR